MSFHFYSLHSSVEKKKELLEDMYPEFSDGALNSVVFCITTENFPAISQSKLNFRMISKYLLISKVFFLIERFPIDLNY